MSTRNAPVDENGNHICDYIGGPCRHLTCARCGKVTNNNTQGHWWGLCTVTGTVRDLHFCCPGDCELTTVTSGDSYEEAVNAPLTYETLLALRLRLASPERAAYTNTRREKGKS